METLKFFKERGNILKFCRFIPTTIEVNDKKEETFLNFGDILLVCPPSKVRGIICFRFSNPIDLARLNQLLKDEEVGSDPFIKC